MSWRESTLGVEIELAYGKSLTETARLGGAVPVYGSNGIVGWHNEALLEGPGIVIGRKGSVGAINYSEKPFWPIDTTYFVQNKGGHDWGFLYFLLLTLGLDQMNGHAVVPGLNRETAYAVPVTLPLIDEQRKIATVLGKVQAAVDVEGKLIRVARELKQAALRQTFTRGLRGEPQKESEFGLVPISWVPIRVDGLGEVVTGTTPKTAERSYYEGGTFDFIAPGDISEHGQEILQAGKKLTEAGLEKSRVLPKGTSCFVCIGSSIGKLGITTQTRSATNQQINAVVPKPEFDPHFVFYTLLWNAERIASHASPSPVPIMSKSLFSEPTVWVTPEPAEQRDIARLLRTIESKVTYHEARQKLLRELFRTLLRDLLTGRRRVA